MLRLLRNILVGGKRNREKNDFSSADVFNELWKTVGSEFFSQRRKGFGATRVCDREVDVLPSNDASERSATPAGTNDCELHKSPDSQWILRIVGS
jgi:hypothetical protein